MKKRIIKMPLVGVGVMIFKGNKILMSKRKGSHGEGEYAFPGGHLEYMEKIEDCARRETKEECGIEIKDIKFQFAAASRKYAPKHYVHIGVTAKWKSGEPRVLEPEKTENWGWYNLKKMPDPIFEFSLLAIRSHKKGAKFFDL